MHNRNSIEFRVWGRYALFTDPLTRIGGEKCSYHIPTYEALKGIVKSIYWKPTIIWFVDRARVIRPVRTETKGVKPIKYGGGTSQHSLSIYTYLADVEYEVQAHFEWNMHRTELEQDRIEGKHYSIAKRMLERGGRQDIFLGTRDCQGYVEQCTFGASEGHYDNAGELAFSMMFHSFDYPDETGRDELRAHFWRPVMKNGVISFKRPEECSLNKVVRDMFPKKFCQGQNLLGVETEAIQIGV